MAAHLVLYLEEHKPGIAYDIMPCTGATTFTIGRGGPVDLVRGAPLHTARKMKPAAQELPSFTV